MDHGLVVWTSESLANRSTAAEPQERGNPPPASHGNTVPTC